MPSAFRTLSLPILAGLLILGFSAFAWQQQHSLAQQHLQAGFDAGAHDIKTRLQQNLLSNAQLLRSVQALYASTGDVSRESFERFLSPLPADAGLRNISLALLVLPEQRTAFVDSQRQAGLRDYAIKPAGERSLYAPISQIVPAPGTDSVEFGRDPFADPDQQRVLMLARDSGQPTLSGKLQMASAEAGGTSPGFIIAAPLYANGKPHNSLDERRSNLLGWVIASFNVRDWIQTTLGPNGPALDLTLLDRQEDTEDSRLFRSDTSSGHSTARLAPLSTSQPLGLGDQIWTLQLRASGNLIAQYGQDSSQRTAVFGGALALILLCLCLALSRSRTRALATAESATEALRESEERWHFALEGAGDGVWDWDVQSSKIHFSPRCDVIMGVPNSGSAAARIHPEDEAPERAAMQACLDGKSSQYVSEHRMQGEDGQWRWIAARGMVLTRTKTGAAQRMIGTVTDITERKTAVERLSGMAQHDALTGLPNRTLFFDLLQHTLNLAKRHKEVLALMYVDLDHFKSVNDNFGQAVANKLLREVAETLRATVRDSDALAHFGGDDFVVLLPSLANEVDAGLVAEKIRVALQRDFNINNRHINITASIGLALFPQHARAAEPLLNSAARAALQAKKNGRNTVCFGPDGNLA
ncbi:MAG: hypothetical protein H6R19_2180 [Proteobacteria bacterium]|nr:hypothetical protein [Pseudomonadota bacterium]